jgi:hypothetical protein
VLQRLSDGQTKRLADALGLDFAALGALATWPLLVARRIVAQQLPGRTPKKRGAPAPPQPPNLGGQIQKPGAAPERPASPPPDERRKRRTKKKAAKAAAASSSDRSSGDSPDSDLEVLEPPIPPAALMPAELGYGPAFDSLVATGCARRWVSTDGMERGIPAAYIACLYRARLWSSKELDAYDKMIRRQAGRSGGKGGRSRREDPRRVAFPHRLSLAFTTDEDLMVNAEHIRFMCEGERISDWAGEAGRRLGGQTARAAYALLLDQLREARWRAAVGPAATVSEPGGSKFV